MALLAIIDQATFSSLPEAIKAEYKEVNGKYQLDVTSVGGFGLEDVSGLKKALESERASVRKAEQALKVFGDLDPSKAREAIEKLGKLSDAPEVKELAERLANERIEEMAKKHKDEQIQLQSRFDTIHTQLNDQLVNNVTMAELQKQGGSIALLMPHMRTQVKMRQAENGQFLAEVIDPKTGNPRVGDSQGNPMTIPQLVESMKANPDFAAAFAGSGATGSGATGSTGNIGMTRSGVKTISRSDRKAMTDNIEKIASGEVVVTD